MQQAWPQVKANKGAPGIDDMTITDYPDFARANWAGIVGGHEKDTKS